jgi:hypothetical protein
MHLSSEVPFVSTERALHNVLNLRIYIKADCQQQPVTCNAWTDLAALPPLCKEPALEVCSRSLCSRNPGMHSLGLLLRLLQQPLCAVRLSLPQDVNLISRGRL